MKVKTILLILMISFGVLPGYGQAQTSSDCYALNGSLQETLPIYNAPSAQAEEIDSLDVREYRLVAHVNPAWTLVFDIDGEVSGWLATDELIFSESCSSGWQVSAPVDETELFPQTDEVTILYPRVNLRAEPTTASARVGQLKKGNTVTVIGQTSTNAGIWYLAETPELGLVWVRSDLVSVPFNKANLMVIEADYVNNQIPEVVNNTTPNNASAPASSPPTNTTGSPSSDTPQSTATPTPANSIVSGSWQHVSTLNEHGCNSGGSPVGTQTTINLNISQAADNSSVTVIYASGYQFTLSLAWQRAGTWVYVGSYNQGKVQVQLNFNSPTSYSGNEVVTHDSGCIVKSSWVGYKLN